MARIQTVTGVISLHELGFTYPHEHLVCFPPPVAMHEDPDYELPSVDKALRELQCFYDAGGRSLVEGTALDYGRDVEALWTIAQSSPVQIIFCTGFNKGRFYPEWAIKASADELAELMVRELVDGVGMHKAKPGFIKVGSWYNVITSEEEKVTRAAAKAHRQIGAPIWVHTEAGTMGLEQLDILEEEGVDLSKVCLGHLDRNPDLWYHRQIAARGAFVGYDGPGKVKYYPDSVRVELIKGMLEAGYGGQLLISGDMGRRSYLKSYQGGPGFEYIITKFIPRLRAEGVAEDEITRIWVENPARWLAF